MKPISSVALTVLAAAALSTALLLARPAATIRRDHASPRAPHDLGPVAGFVENLGQWPADIAFVASARGEWVHVSDRRIEFGRGAARFAIAPVASVEHPPTGSSATGSVCNFLFGADPRTHVRAARVYAAVEQRHIAPGVDLVLRAAAKGQPAAFAYDLHIARDARTEDIEFVVTGAASLHVDDATNELVLAAPSGELRQSAPVAWLQDGERRTAVACRFEVRGADRFGFCIDTHGAATDLCIDPDLRWSTCFGGSSVDNGNAVAVAANGDVFLAGTTQSTDLPVAPGTFDPSYNGANPIPWLVGDGFVARLAASNGALLWCTYLGGNENDQMTVAGAIGDDPVVAGWTSSLDFPTTPGAFDTTHNGTLDGYTYGGGDVFVTRLAANGQSLVWSSFLGGAQLEYPTSLAIAPNGEVAVAGHVHSLNFPTTPGAFSNARLGFSDFFVTRFAADGASLVGSTYCGGSDGEEYPHALAIAPNGDMIAAGATNSTNLPVTAGAYDLTFNGGSSHEADGFVARFTRTAALVWCTYLGTPSNEYPRGIALHTDGSMTLTGAIDGPGLPTTPGVFGPAPFGGNDGFAWRLSGNGSTSIFATYVGGSADDIFFRATSLGGGRVAVCGVTASPNVPLSRGSAQSTPLGQNDGWVCVLASDGSAVDYGAVFGGPYGDYGYDLKSTPGGELVTSGVVYFNNFLVTPGGLPYVNNGDAYCVQVAGLPLGVTRHGAPSGACARGARVRARSGPFVGESSFELSAGDVLPGSPTLAAASTAVLGAALPVLGFDLWVDPGTLIATPSVAVDAYACAHLPLPVPPSAGLAGAALAVQFVWIDTCAGLSFGASDAVAIVIQP